MMTIQKPVVLQSLNPVLPRIKTLPFSPKSSPLESPQPTPHFGVKNDILIKIASPIFSIIIGTSLMSLRTEMTKTQIEKREKTLTTLIEVEKGEERQSYFNSVISPPLLRLLVEDPRLSFPEKLELILPGIRTSDDSFFKEVLSSLDFLANVHKETFLGQKTLELIRLAPIIEKLTSQRVNPARIINSMAPIYVEDITEKRQPYSAEFDRLEQELQALLIQSEAENLD